MAARRALARPRVECSSSRVAINDGHIPPSIFFRQTPFPLHISTARWNPPSAEKSKNVGRSSDR